MYERAIATALRMIDKKGQDGIWVVVETTKNPNMPWKADEITEAQKPIRIVTLPARRVDQESIFFVPDTEIEAGMVVGLIGKQSFKPTAKDYCIVGNKRFSIKSISTLAPNEEGAILHKVLMRE